MLRELRLNIDVLSFAAARRLIRACAFILGVASEIDRGQKKNSAATRSFIDGSVTHPAAQNKCNLIATNAYTHDSSAKG
jgi:hypothetical protein